MNPKHFDKDIGWAEVGYIPENYTPTIVEDYSDKTGAITSHLKGIDDKLGNFISVKDFGAVGDGIADDTAAMQAALDSSYPCVIVPVGIYKTTLTLVVPSYKTFIGTSPNIRDYNGVTSSVISYDGAIDHTAAVIRVGTNIVGATPSTTAHAVVVRNLYLRANNKAGFGIYGTSVSTESLIDSITARDTLEYGFYFARSWYATYSRLVSIYSKGQGLAFGMPLVLLDGTNYTSGWGSVTYEMNSVFIRNIRSSDAGRYYSIDNPNTYDPTNTIHRMKGYGIGIGRGNSIHVSNLTSEASGGAGLYIYNDGRPICTIQGGYIEIVCQNSGLANNVIASIIIDVTTSSIGLEIRDVYINSSSGGIYHTGAKTQSIWLKNIFYPQFLKSLDGETSNSLYSHVLKSNVYEYCGRYNTLDILMSSQGYGVVDTKSTFTINCLPTSIDSYSAIYIKKTNSNTYYGGYTVTHDDGSTEVFAYPTLTTSYQLAVVVAGNVISITKSGVDTGLATNPIHFKILSTPATWR